MYTSCRAAPPGAALSVSTDDETYLSFITTPPYLPDSRGGVLAQKPARAAVEFLTRHVPCLLRERRSHRRSIPRSRNRSRMLSTAVVLPYTHVTPIAVHPARPRNFRPAAALGRLVRAPTPLPARGPYGPSSARQQRSAHTITELTFSFLLNSRDSGSPRCGWSS